MGQFSFMFADTVNTEPLNIGGAAYVACPDGTFIKECNYEGYGRFGDKDIYELVVDWNKDCIPEKFLTGEKSPYMADFLAGKSEEYMTSTYGEDWKRFIGIAIACNDKDNAALRYPIKICMYEPEDYAALPASIADPNQGWGYEEDDEYGYEESDYDEDDDDGDYPV